MFTTVLGEELLFRGYLLPRMNGAFGRGDWVANGLLFTVYHLHVPWAMPATLLDIVHPGLPDEALPKRLDRDRGAQRPERVLCDRVTPDRRSETAPLLPRPVRDTPGMSGVLTSDRILEDSLSGATSGRRASFERVRCI